MQHKIFNFKIYDIMELIIYNFSKNDSLINDYFYVNLQK